MKKILISFGVTVGICLIILAGFIIANKKNMPDEFISNDVIADNVILKKEIIPNEIIEYKDYVYYILPREDEPANDNVICRMKKDGTEKEIVVNNTGETLYNNHTMYLYKNYLYYSGEVKGKISRLNLDTDEKTHYPFNSILYLDNEFMTYRTSDGVGVLKMEDIDSWDFE